MKFLLFADDENPNVKVNFKVIKDPKEIQKYMNHFLSSEEKADKSDDTDDDSTVSDTEDTEQHTDTQTDTDTRTGTDTGISTDTEATTENVDPEVNTVKKVSTDRYVFLCLYTLVHGHSVITVCGLDLNENLYN